jgi:hypothetical protein
MRRRLSQGDAADADIRSISLTERLPRRSAIRDKFIHHEGREEHEVKNLENINFRILRVLRALRGAVCFVSVAPQRR